MRSSSPISAYVIEEGLRAELTSRCACGWSVTAAEAEAIRAFSEHRAECRGLAVAC